MKIRFLADCILFFSLFSVSAIAAETSTATDFTELQKLHDIAMQRSQSDAIAKYVQDALNENTEALGSEKIQQFSAQGQKLHSDVQRRIRTIFNADDIKPVEQIGDADMSKAHFDTLIFASFSMSTEDLKQLYKATSPYKKATIVFRGLPPGCENITDAIRKIQSIAVMLDMKNPPNAVLNPVWFRQYNITSVPVMLALENTTDNQTGDLTTNKEKEPVKVKASVSGLINPTWLFSRIKEGHSGDFGVQGPVFEIIERDLIDEMKERAAKVNWQEKKANARNRMWDNIPITPLTPSFKYRKRLIDPSIIVKEDVLTPKGQFIAHKGERINPLERKAFTRLLVAFNPTDAREVAFVEKNLDKWLKERNLPRSEVRLLITDYDRKGKMSMYKNLIKRFGQSVFVLTPDIKETFILEHHPSIIYADGLNFVVEEFDSREFEGVYNNAS